ncbi:MAG: hypothetical protein RL398_3181 [Planctomycetota bacterium]|jgi:hypothetical protein
MNFAAPWALLGLLAVPAVVALHLFRRRLPQRRVAAAFLFGGDRLAADAGRQRTKLLRTPSLWLECLAAALAALWLSGPTFGGSPERHVVFVLDDSASMAAGSTLDDAVADLRRRLANLDSGDRASLVRTGLRPSVLLGPRALPAEALDALGDWRPARPGHDPRPAIDLARELAAGAGEVVFVTDRPPVWRSDDLTVACFGAVRPNAAILTAQRFARSDGTEELRLAVMGYGGAVNTRVTVTVAEVELRSLDIALADQPVRLTVELPKPAGVVHVRLADDALALDNTATLLPEPLRIVAFTDLLSGERRKELGFDRALAALEGCRPEVDPLAAQLLFAEQSGRPIAGQIEVVLPLGAGPREAFAGPFVVDRMHPWTAGVTLQGVAWLAEERNVPGQPLVAAGNRVLVSEEFLEQGRRAWINVDGARGNVARSPDWPILLANLVEAARTAVPGPERANVLVGGEARYRRSLRNEAEDAEVSLVDPDGAARLGTGGATLGWQIEVPGLHRLVGRTGQPLGVIAARFLDAGESDPSGAATRTLLPSATATAAVVNARDTSAERRWLALLLGLVLLLDWWWLQERRWRPAR